ncbi:carbon-nitrogen hydrolase family protein [Streptosporangium sp. NPDC006013]|uniref:carbon-nitrogen hydrolase family protein n=1 Tax=Streptosporangium sp. NPDC006013 TaxID=3155596 RepID=UPI0033A0E7B8
MANERVLTAAQVAAGGVDAATVDALHLAEGPHDLIVLPEIANVPYFPVAPDLGEWLADTLADQDTESVFAPYRRLARRTGGYVVAGLCLPGPERSRNAAVVFDRAGEVLPGRGVLSGDEVLVYDKTHLCNVRHYGSVFLEDQYFQPGPELVVWDLDFARLGVLICYDRHFPEAWSTLRAGEVGIVAVPTASPAGTAPTFLAEMQAMALQQSVYAVVANRVGPESLPGGTTADYLGRSAVLGPDGAVLNSADRGPFEQASAPYDEAHLDSVRAAMGLAASRRPALYRL